MLVKNSQLTEDKRKLTCIVFSNGSCDLESLVSQIKLPSRLKTLVKREHADAVKHSTSNWWDLVPVYCDETLSNEAALDSILETTGVTQEMTEISMEPRAF